MKKKLIDADALTMHFADWQLQEEDTNTREVIEEAIRAIDNAPAVDAAPVRTGSWNEEKVGCTKIYICSCCGKKYYISPLNDNYCASCGALMKKEDRYEL